MGILTYEGNSFFLDGKPFTVISGAMHYFRIPRAYWHDRLQKLYECGFNTPSQFYREFKRTFGVTPSDFRRKGSGK